MLEEIDTGLRKKVVVVGETRQEELTVCSVKTGVNDFLDYISLATALICPTVLGPALLLCVAPLYLCREVKGPTEKPSPLFLFGLVLSYLSTYTLHMLVSEIYITDSFTFLIVKNICGFLFLIIVPIHIIISQEDIRRGLGPVFGSSVICPVVRHGVSIDVITPSDYSPCQL